VHDPGGSSDELDGPDREHGPLGHLPTTAHLAQSFLHTEPPQERAKLQAAMAESQSLRQSTHAESDDDEPETGLGAGYSLPGFIAGFLKGVGDRLRLWVTGVNVDVDFTLDTVADGSAIGSSAGSETVSVRLSVDSIAIDEVRKAHGSAGTPPKQIPEGAAFLLPAGLAGTRRVVLENVQAMLLSDASLFAFLAQLSGPPSPSATHSGAFRKDPTARSGEEAAAKSSPSSSSSSVGLEMVQSSILRPNRESSPDPSAMLHPSPIASPRLSQLEASIATSDGERFADAGSDDELLASLQASQPSMHESELSCGRYADVEHGRGMRESDFKEHVSNAAWLYNIEDSDTLPHGSVVHPRYRRASRSHILPATASILRHDQGSPGHPTADATPEATVGHEIQSGIFFPEEFKTMREDPDAWNPSLDHVLGSVTAPLQNEPPPRDYGSSASPPGDIGPELGTSPDEDLTRSKIFSHEEAASMYMSALSHASVARSQHPNPGGWGGSRSNNDPVEELHVRSPPSINLHPSVNHTPTAEQPAPTDQEPRGESTADGLASRAPLETSTSHQPNAEATEEHPPASLQDEDRSRHTETVESHSDKSPRIIKPFLSIGSIVIEIPQHQDESPSHEPDSESTSSARSRTPTRPGVPGAFSVHDGATSDARFRTPSAAVGRRMPPPKNDPKAAEAPDPVVITVNDVVSVGDMGLTRLIVMAAQQTSSSGARDPSSVANQPTEEPPPLRVLVRINAFRWNFVDVVNGHVVAPAAFAQWISRPRSPQDNGILLTAMANDVQVSIQRDESGTQSKVSVAKFAFGYEDEHIISFNSSLKMRESTQDVWAPKDHDLLMTVMRGPTLLKVDVTTLPIRVALDLARLDETFGWFGGLSTVLGLGNSMVSTVTMTDPKAKTPSTTKPSRGVRFDAPTSGSGSPPTKEMQTKLTMRVGGLFVDLQGKAATIHVEGTAIKIVSRSEGIGVQLDKLKVGGPNLLHGRPAPAMLLQINNIRMEYLSNPKENDLARLVALLAPSRDRDGPEDDILLDTFLRQRRQGGVLRLTVENVHGAIGSVDELDRFHALSEELKKLSTVAKYLPEDDRPGVLTLALVQHLTLDIRLNEVFHDAVLKTENVEVAHVTLPALFLLGIGSVAATRGLDELVGPALPLDRLSDDQSPTVMLKMIGDEMEPTVRVRLWNLRVEYHVSVLMAAMGISETASGEVIIADVVSSVATLTGKLPAPRLASGASSSSGKSSHGSGLLKFDVAVRDSIIGLNPRRSPARGIVVLTNTKLVGSFPKPDQPDLAGILEIKKASFMVVDNTANLTAVEDANDDRSQVNGLVALGYVSISDISSAKITLKVTAAGGSGERSIDVEVRDDLFVLETCADSTQTVLAILNGLKPPTPPSQELKYRTEVIPVEDMLASFSGAAFEADADDGSDLALGLDDGDMMDDEVPQNLEFVSSFYNPDPASTADDIANSMLEDDLSSLANPPKTREIGDKRLLHSFQEQFEVAPGSGSLHFDEDHFGASSIVGGTAHRWNSDSNTYDLANEAKTKGSPLRLRVRDVHVIWNLFDGYDWQHTRDAISQVVADVETKAAERLAHRDRRRTLEADEEENEVIGDFLFNSIYIGVSAKHDPRDLARQVNRNIDDAASEAESCATTTTVSASPSRAATPRAKRKRLRLRRSTHHKMTFELRGVSADVVVFPPGSGETQSSIDVRVRDLDIFDHLRSSTWRKFATYLHDAGERESGTNMVHLEILNVKPVPDLAASEMILKATVLPLRLHVDQDALDFLTRFFEFKDDAAPIHTAPSEVPFLQRVEVNSIQVKLDFKPKHVDYAGLRSGHTTEFMNFFILDGADMVLRHVIIYGVSGFDKLGKTLNDIWMPDVKSNQLAGVLAGLAPIRSLVNVGAGVRDLVVVPMREYRRDGRLVRAVQKGTLAFAKTTTTELAKLGAKLAIGTQTVLQGAEDYLVPQGAPTRQRLDSWEAAGHPDSDDDGERKHISPYADQPIGVVQGLRGAYRHLERDLLMARDAIVAMPGEAMESGSAGGAARAVLRGAPTVILRPALGVTKAVGQTLLGATNSLDRGERRRVEDVSFFSPPLIHLSPFPLSWRRGGFLQR
jgi:autophagy-related protein 2